MSLRIQNNVEAFNAHRQLVGTGREMSKSMERLSSGYRINRAADDAAGLAISEKLRSQIGGVGQSQRNAQDAVSLVQTAEGALNEVHSMLQRVRDLAVQYNNGTLATADKAAITAEVAQLCSEISKIGNDTKFNGIALLSGSSAITFQSGAENVQSSESRIRDVDMASEMVNFTKLHILQQAGTSMLAQADSAPQSVLTLL